VNLNATLFFFSPYELSTLSDISAQSAQKMLFEDWHITQEDSQSYHGVGQNIDSLKRLSDVLRNQTLDFQIEIFEDSDRLVTRIIG